MSDAVSNDQPAPASVSAPGSSSAAASGSSDASKVADVNGAATETAEAHAEPKPSPSDKFEPVDHSKIKLSLNEMCMRLSKEGHSVELIAAFQHEELHNARDENDKKIGSRHLDLESAYRERFKTFADRPAL